MYAELVQNETFCCKLRRFGRLIRSKIMPDKKLTLDALLRMTPVIDEKDLVAHASRQLFLSRVRSVRSVRKTFFPDHKANKYEEFIHPDWFDFEQFGILLVLQAIWKLKDQYQIYQMIDGPNVEEALKDMYSSPLWKKIGFALYTLLFPDFVKDFHTGLTFRQYMESDGEGWAQALVKKVADPRWQYSLVHPHVSGNYPDDEYNRDVNILLIKLHLLDPKSVFMAYEHLRKALPDLNLELATTNYLHVGDPLDWRHIRLEVERAVEEASCATNTSRLSLAELDMYHGVGVVEFITELGKDMNLWTGTYPKNQRTSRFRDRCTIL